jgi:ATP-dependent Lhr-like helicase
MDPQSASEIGRLSPEAILQVKQEAWPQPRSADELHDGLMIAGFVDEGEIASGEFNQWQHYFTELQRQRRATRFSHEHGMLWVSAECLQSLQVICPVHEISPQIDALVNEQSATKVSTVTEIMRNRLEVLGPVTPEQLARPLGLAVSDVERALSELQQEGYAIQGRFDPGQSGVAWCERGLLARIHRYTLKRLRSEIEPVSVADFMRFLFNWHGLDEPAQGVAALERVMLQLEGISLPAGSWEEEILPVRLQPYFSSELDELCGSGRLAWLRLNPPDVKENKRKNPAIKTTPLAFVLRSHLSVWRPLECSTKEGLSGTAVKVLDFLKEWGASFFDDLQQQSGLLKTQLESALGELVAWGLVNSDQFHGLRAMITPEKRGKQSRRRSQWQAPLASGGRWSLIRAPISHEHESQRIEQIARTLLTRYGIVFRKLLERESGLPPWRDLLYCLRRLEARGEIRGGRFVQGFAGEHFALPEAVSVMRETRNRKDTDELVSISSADPLNLTGIVTPGKRIAAQAGHRILYKNGNPIATNQGGEITIDGSVAQSEHWHIKNLLRRKQHAANYHKSEQGPLF